MRHAVHFFWPVVFGFYALWTFRVLYLPAPQTTDAVSFILNTGFRILFFLLPIILVILVIYKEPLQKNLGLMRATLAGWLAAFLYSGGLIAYAFITKTITLPTNPWVLISFPFAPIIEELVFRGFIFSELQKRVGNWQAVCISSVLFLFIHFPGWLFLAGIHGEQFFEISGQVLIFSFIQGAIRLVAKSVYPNILVHLINNALFLS